MITREPEPYVGRFAPSPTGPLHFGSLIAAVASYLQARINNGTWLLRIEDIDPPREPRGADKLILEALELYGFEWDGPVIRQSRTTPAHEAYIDDLVARGLAYRCSCSRKQLAGEPQGALGSIYPGTCRAGCRGDEFAIRVRTDDRPVTFVDGLQGPVTQRLETESGDFIIRRRDGLVAYNIAVVVDDAEQRVTEVVRGIDLLDSTPRHIYLQRLLGFATPAYLHIPVATNAAGQKLSKLTGAQAVPVNEPARELCRALQALQQSPPPGLAGEGLGATWQWAMEHWDIGTLEGMRTIVAA